MMNMESLGMANPATFGRDGAMFESLLGFIAQLSIILWGLVVLTAVVRFVGIRLYRRGAARTAAASVLATDTIISETFEEARQPAEVPVAVSASAALANRVPRYSRAPHVLPRFSRAAHLSTADSRSAKV